MLNTYVNIYTDEVALSPATQPMRQKIARRLAWLTYPLTLLVCLSKLDMPETFSNVPI